MITKVLPTYVLSCTVLEQLLGDLQLSTSTMSGLVQRSIQISNAVYRGPVGVGASAQQQQRRLPGPERAGEVQWCCLGRRGSGETHSPLCRIHHQVYKWRWWSPQWSRLPSLWVCSPQQDGGVPTRPTTSRWCPVVTWPRSCPAASRPGVGLLLLRLCQWDASTPSHQKYHHHCREGLENIRFITFASCN